MMTIHVRQSTMVRPIEPTPRHRLWISNVDLVSPRVHEKSVYFYRPNGSPDFFDAAQLRDALARVLVPFYPVAGRIAKDEAGRMEIDCNEEGVLFVEADSDATVDNFGDFSPTVMLKPLIPIIDYADDHLSSHPLLLLQVTYLKCGGVSLGVSFNHQLIDGLSGLHFINSWSDVARGADVRVAPFLDRSLLRARSPPTPRFDHVEYQPPPSLPTFSQCVDVTTPAAKLFQLTREQLNLLIKRPHCPSGAAYSTYVVLAAHVWRCVCISRNLPPEQMTQLYVVVDGRRRLCPPLKKEYFGNAVFIAKPSATAGETTKCTGKGNLQLVSRIQEAIARMDDEYMRSALDYLEVQPNLDTLARGAHQHRSPNFRLTSWVHLPIHDADFRWGRPVFTGPGYMSHEGMAYLLPSPTHDGSLSLAICLKPQHMLKFQKLIYEVLP